MRSRAPLPALDQEPKHKHRTPEQKVVLDHRNAEYVDILRKSPTYLAMRAQAELDNRARYRKLMESPKSTAYRIRQKYFEMVESNERFQPEARWKARFRGRRGGPPPSLGLGLRWQPPQGKAATDAHRRYAEMAAEVKAQPPMTAEEERAERLEQFYNLYPIGMPMFAGHE